MSSVQDIVRKLNLKSHPEGGYYSETYRSEGIVAMASLADGYSGARNYGTAIYFLLEAGDFSALHRIHQDELWHFYLGDPLEVHVIDKKGVYHTHLLTNELGIGVPQLTVSGGQYFGSRVQEGGTFALVGCTCSPGFDFQDFEMPSQSALLELYPDHQQIIQEMTRL